MYFNFLLIDYNSANDSWPLPLRYALNNRAHGFKGLIFQSIDAAFPSCVFFCVGAWLWALAKTAYM
jgi:hypothetical protein